MLSRCPVKDFSCVLADLFPFFSSWERRDRGYKYISFYLTFSMNVPQENPPVSAGGGFVPVFLLWQELSVLYMIKSWKIDKIYGAQVQKPWDKRHCLLVNMMHCGGAVPSGHNSAALPPVPQVDGCHSTGLPSLCSFESWASKALLNTEGPVDVNELYFKYQRLLNKENDFLLTVLLYR